MLWGMSLTHGRRVVLYYGRQLPSCYWRSIFSFSSKVHSYSGGVWPLGELDQYFWRENFLSIRRSHRVKSQNPPSIPSTKVTDRRTPRWRSWKLFVGRPPFP